MSEKLTDNGKKYCHRCDQVKPIEVFANKGTGKHSNCLECMHDLMKKYRVKKPKIHCERCNIDVYPGNLTKHNNSVKHNIPPDLQKIGRAHV